MARYSFERFRRDLLTSHATWDTAFSAEYAEFRRLVDAIDAALDPAERADPRSITTARTIAIEAAASTPAGMLALVLKTFDLYENIAGERRWWKPHPASPIFWLGLPALVVALGFATFAMAAYLISIWR